MLYETVPTIQSFFESYLKAFELLDITAIVDHFAYPLHITSDAKEIHPISITTKQEWVENVEQLLEMYRRIGFVSAQILNQNITELSPRLAQVILHWGLYNGEKHLLYEFEAAYTVAMINEEWRITAIAHNEIPRYRESLAKRQA